MCKSITPVAGIREPEQAIANCQALGWRLTNNEIWVIDDVSFEGYTTKLWQQR
jgi:aryl-alcohol dehydrogenase-like predicted oxidoreductase